MSEHRGPLAGVWPGNYHEGCDCAECRAACKNQACHDEKHRLQQLASVVTGERGERLVRHELMKHDLAMRVRLRCGTSHLTNEAVSEIFAVFKDWPAR